MKPKYLFFILIFLSSFATLAQTQFKFSGEIQNPTERKVLITLYRDWVGEEEEYEIELNEKNQFSFSSSIKHIAYIDFYYADQGFHYWIIEPTDDITIKFSPKNFWTSIKVWGNGSENWNYYIKQREKFEVKRDFEMEAERQSQTAQQQYFNFLDNEQLTQLEYLEKTPNLSKIFIQSRKADIIGAIQNYKINYLSSKKYGSWLEEKVKTTLKLEALADSVQANSLEYGNMFQNLMDLFIAKSSNRKHKELTENEELNLIKSSYDKDYFSFKLIERVLAFKLNNMIDAENISPKVQTLVEDFLATANDRDYKNYLSNKVNFSKTLSKGSPAKPFKLKDIDGKDVSLKDFQGKIVYLDFWASWCGPCIYDMKFMEPIKEKFKAEVVFIQISLDSEVEWKDAVKMYHIKGINLRVDENSSITKNYGISGIPAYFLIDRKGNFAVSQVADPSHEEGQELIKQIEEVLQRN
ncbi:Redoxin domain protein [Emticicia oligotrophica DSM 17448]|uniref:Redoxin domain protein n=1 Tax=Emticicia oligotrophica (strain DSM 17448 / CIP 109782 / MTCC 6937 / GPTSA100-15) TaxID=929562 RepID=A0ABM5N537_EMTOG|nr:MULTISPECIES: TlpA disulfide reductase family protein [Emticicia]AFK04552.1 Redoxin domain protein [Emticicia oligotrophica DSM 17448]